MTLALTPGTRFGRYEIAAEIGKGGMGEVYRARDTRLKRDVALKSLPESLSQDPERVGRFEREAEILASLNHPNIAAIHGLEESEGVLALVLEFVEGGTLADHVAQGPIPIDDALVIARQISEALEAAHEQGIIHRDLKPANIKVREDGTVKVLDFGLAKMLDSGSAPRSTDATHSPTLSLAATQAGVILGTAAYMAPEQAKGRLVDKRSDMWAFGCVVYEMLTGRRAFEGEDLSDTLAAVLRGDPDWQALPAGTPVSIRRLLRRCLEKDRKRRQSDIADARLEIEDALSAPAPDAAAVSTTRSRRVWPAVVVAAASGLVAGDAAAGAIVWMAARPGPGPVTRTAIETSGETALSLRVPGNLTILPDGSGVVYAAADRLVVRNFDRFEATSLTGLGSPAQPFISPNGQWIGFFDGLALKKVAMTGGPPATVVANPLRGGGPMGATWGADDTIVFATSMSIGLERVGAAGGRAERLTMLDQTRGEIRHTQPRFLPGGRALLYTIQFVSGGGPGGGPAIALLDLETRARTVLLHGASEATYLPSGHLLYRTEGSLRAVAFDLERRALIGTPVPVVAPVADYDVADNGTLVYRATGGVFAITTKTLVWVDRQGRETPLGAEPGPYVHPRLAPDETRVAVLERGSIRIWDVRRAMMTPGPSGNAAVPLWLPDSRHLVFSALRGGRRPNLHVQPVDGTGTKATRPLPESPNSQHPTGLTRDGTQIVFNDQAFNDLMSTQYGDIHLLTLGPTPKASPLVETRFDDRGGVVSPNDRWLAYESNRSGIFEIFVQPFPAVEADPIQVSPAGGTQPLWARNGRELFYVAPDGLLMSVAVETQGPAWSSRAPVRVLDKPYFSDQAGVTTRQYDVSADGQRFLMLKEEPGDADAAPSINVVQNWREELKRLVPAK